MILQEISNTNISVDLCRPDLKDDRDRAMWLELHNWIRESDVPVAVSAAFKFVDQYCVTGSGYLGGGMQYCFFFKTEDDKQIFVAKYREIFE